ncbi:MAG: glycine cleavage system protein GcvH [Pseudohongiellaceae bacterium]
MSNFPDDLKYATSHEWARVDDDGVATIGISDHAQDALGDIVFVELPEVGAMVIAKEEIAVVESVKAASDIYSPLSGEVLAINEELVDSPETVNSQPYDSGWFFKVKLSDEAELDELLDAEAYSEHCESE